MYRKALFLAVLLSGLFGTAPAVSAQELLTNPGFEEGTNTDPWDDTIPPTGWQKYGNWGWAGWKNNRPAHTGTKFVDAGAWNYEQYGQLIFTEYFRHNVHPCRYGGLRNWLASSQFVNRILVLSHSSFVPGIFRAITPTIAISVNGPP